MTDKPHFDPAEHTETSEGDVADMLEDTTEIVPVEAGMFGKVMNQLGNIFAIGFLISMAVLIYEIIMRHVFNAPTIWAHETSTFICGMGFVFGGLFCASRNKHIRVVLIYDMVGPRARRVLDIIISLICAASTAFFAYAAWLMVQRAAFSPDGSIRLETSGTAWNPPFPAILKIFLLVVMIALTVQFLLLAFNYLRGKTSSAANARSN